MKVFRRFQTEHDDFIHDIAYDFYGKRLATCSSDNKLKVWDQDEKGDWQAVAEIKGHSGSINKVAWAHPEFGQVLASCSADRVVNIYQEIVDSERNQKTWQTICHLVDCREAVQDIKFAPRHLGLKLATCCLDGQVRIYEAVDVMNLSNWPLVEEFEADKKDCNCLSWNQSPFDAPTMVVGSQRTARVWEYHERTRRWHPVCELSEHGETVNDVAWAPNLGRTYHLIATACKDQIVRIFRLWLNERGTYQHELICQLSDHGSEVWRVEWNVTGTILASSGEDGMVRLWKQDMMGQWKMTCVVAGKDRSSAQEEYDEKSN